jgi:hypothetical protein
MATAGQAAPSPFPAICAADSPFASSADLPQSWSTEDENYELLPGGKYFFDSAKLSRYVEQREKNDVVALYLVTHARK